MALRRPSSRPRFDSCHTLPPYLLSALSQGQDSLLDIRTVATYVLDIDMCLETYKVEIEGDNDQPDARIKDGKIQNHNIWTVIDRDKSMQELDSRAKTSRMVYKIMREEIESRLFFWERELWPQRVLPKIAEARERELDGLAETFEDALDRYYSRSNGPGVRREGLCETIFPTSECDIEEAIYFDSFELLSTAGGNLCGTRKGSTDSSGLSTSENEPSPSTPGTSSSSMTDLSDLVNTLTEIVKDNELVRIFLPRKKPLPPMELDNHEFGWL